MKTLKRIILGLTAVLALVSCDNPVALGGKLDLEGPVLNFTAPVPRKAVKAEFSLEGTLQDNGGVSRFLVKIERDRNAMPRQWRYENGKWEISDDYGASWKPFPQGKWEGSDSVVWSIPVDMSFINPSNGLPEAPEDGQYMFIGQAWDSADMSDDNSFKTLILIVDNDPPKVSVSKPLLYSRYLSYDIPTDKFDNLLPGFENEIEEIESLRKLTEYRNPEYIGKFQTNSFDLQWGIDDHFNIWSFDLRFYNLSVEIDERKDTPLPENYIFRLQQNDIHVPDAPNPADYVKPNGTIQIPALEGEKSSGTIGKANWELKNPVGKGNTTIRVVAVCYDAASNSTQEKTLGFFIYWAEADTPWITFSGDLKKPEDYNSGGTFGTTVKDEENGAFLIYPGVELKAIAFHPQGIVDVKYTLWKLTEPLPSMYDENKRDKLEEKTITNEQTSRGKFDWGFLPEPRSAVYVIEAQTLSVSGKTSDVYKAVFQVKDISFPGFPTSPAPNAQRPLFEAIQSDSITIKGIVDDATGIDSLRLAWINPQSKGFAAMSQLEYFRDADYSGWLMVDNISAGGAYVEEGNYDQTNKNKIWKLKIDNNTLNPDTQRFEYEYSITIPLSHLNMGYTGSQPLKSQVFLLRATNQDRRTTIITYTPQGDESPPVIKITSVDVQNNGLKTLTPGLFSEQISKFKEGNTITINGTWADDSVAFVSFDTYLKNNFEISVNQKPVNASLLSFTGTSGSASGTWKAVVTVGGSTNNIPLADLKDTLVIAAKLKDIGGNNADDAASWLIESDALRLIRISSNDADRSYKVGETINIFLEFNKPVLLKTGVANPVLNLRVGDATNVKATYASGQTSQNTQQFFTYTVTSGQNTTTGNPWLDVIGLDGLAAGNYWEANNYPFTWVSTLGGTNEEIRITMNSAHTEGAVTYNNALLRRLPVAGNTADLMYTLARGKNIGIDTDAPKVTGINTSLKEGHYPLGSEILINVVFSEDVKIESTPPQLVLNITNGSNNTRTTTGTPKVNGKTVTFSYTAQATDTTGDNKVIINSFTGGQITDIAGTNMEAYTFNATNGALNGGGSGNNGNGVFINTVAPEVPTFRALRSNNNTNIISNTVSGAAVTGESGTTVKTLQNVYNDELWFAIMPNMTGGNNRLGYLEYSLDPSTVSSTDPSKMNWKRIDSTTGTPFKQDIYGSYYVRVRQTDKAGNTSNVSQAVSLTWDPGTLVTRIDSSSPNGTYTNNSSRADTINVTVYFRKPLNITGTPSITLNTIRGTTNGITVNGTAASSVNQLSFTYTVAANDNTPSGQNLDVTALNITATDAQGVNVGSFIALPTDTTNLLKNRKSIIVQTGALTISSGPTYSITQTGDEATGTITVKFSRPVSKRSGDITITQQSTGYRLPAVLTETQANRYKNISGFNDYYSRGTNGASSTGVPDTSTKFVLNYSQTAVVTPDNTSGISKLAYDFQQAEKVTLPVSSQAVTVSGDTLTITLDGSNALQVLGAAYDVNIPAGVVQDSLSFQSPASNSSFTAPGINRPFVRVDKKINADRITAQTGDATNPYLLASYSNLITTTARLDCRTPNSIVRYTANGAEHVATGVDSRGSQGSGANWKNTANNADTNNLNGVAQQTVSATTGTEYNNFTGTGAATHLTVGTAANNNIVQGYVWRIAVISRNSAGTANSTQYDEIAFRTVLTYEIGEAMNLNVGQAIGSGDQLWIRGGDAVGSSSVSGFPLNWQDDYDKLNTDKKRAGIRLLRRESATTAMSTTSVWRWVTWEINVRTWHDVVLARNVDASTPGANDAWQYGPRQWAYQRGGWSATKDEYTLYPGKHRWVRIMSDAYASGSVNFSLQFNTRAAQSSVTFTQPSP